MTVYCVDDRHGTPCPADCPACEDRGEPDDCDQAARVEADTPADAARAAGWSEAYIAAVIIAAD